MVTKLAPRCYHRNCEEKAKYKWLPNKNKGHLHVCQEHYDFLLHVFSIDMIGEEDGFIVVRVRPEPEEES